MIKLDETVKKEVTYIASVTAILSVLMQAVFLVLGAFLPAARWDYTVLLGNILGGGVAVLNFLGLGITVQKAIEKDEKDAKNMMRASQSIRTFLMFGAAILGLVLGCFNAVATIVPLFFPRIAIMLKPIFTRRNSKKEGE